MESYNGAYNVHFSGLQNQPHSQFSNDQNNSDWEIIGANSWSQGLDTLSMFSDQFCNIPGYGDASIHMEKVAGTIHIYIDAISDLEISAKDIRSRITMAPNEIHSLPTSPISVSDVSEAGKDSNMYKSDFFWST